MGMQRGRGCSQIIKFWPSLLLNSTQVTVASVEDSLEVVCARQTKIVADKSIGECAGESWDLIALPVSGEAGGVACTFRQDYNSVSP